MLKAICMAGRSTTTRSDSSAMMELYHKAVYQEINQRFSEYAKIFIASFFDHYFSRDDLVSSGNVRVALTFLPLIKDYATRYTYFMLIAPRFNEYRSMIDALYDNRDNPDVRNRAEARKDMERPAGEVSAAVVNTAGRLTPPAAIRRRGVATPAGRAGARRRL
jgi:hypothetical protein